MDVFIDALCRLFVKTVQNIRCKQKQICLKCRLSKGAGETQVSASAFAIKLRVMETWRKEEIMKRRNVLMKVITGVLAMAMMSGCGATSSGSSASGSSASSSSVMVQESGNITEDKSGGEKEVLRVGMECAYAPFNWTQDTASTPDGSVAVPIYDSAYYAYGYDVAVAQMLADEMGMDLEIHKVEWSSIGISMDAGDYDCIIAGMGRTAEREMAYAFTDPYYYRDNCIVVKKDGAYANVKGLSDLAGTGCKVTTQLGTGWIPLLDQIEGAQTGSNYETTS